MQRGLNTMGIWAKIKSWLTPEQFKEVESSDELKDMIPKDTDETVGENTEADTEAVEQATTVAEEEPKGNIDKDEEMDTEGKSELTEDIESDVKDDTAKSVASQVETVNVLEDGWLNDKNEVDLSKVKDEKLKAYIESLVSKESTPTSTATGFNPASPIKATGYHDGMTFEEALQMELSRD